MPVRSNLSRLVITNRYLHQSVLRPILVALLLLISLFVIFAMADLLNDAVARLLSASSLPQLLLVQTLIACEVVIPSAMYFGVVDGLGRMYRNSEMLVLFASGWSEARTAAALCQLLVPMAILVAILTLSVRPVAYEISHALEAESSQRIQPGNLVPGRFYPFGPSDFTLSVGAVEGDVMRDVFVQGEGSDGSRVIRAATGRLISSSDDGTRRIELTDGYAYKLGENSDHEYTYERLEFELESVSEDVRDMSGDSNRRAKPTEQLLASANSKEIAELQWRLSLPLLAFLLGLIAVPLARSAPRQSRFRHMVIAILAYTVVFNLVVIAKGWVESGLVGAFPGIWWVHGMLLLTLVLLSRRTVPR